MSNNQTYISNNADNHEVVKMCMIIFTYCLHFVVKCLYIFEDFVHFILRPIKLDY